MPATKPKVRLTKALAATSILALAALALAACLPKPDDPVEYLHQPDSIVIQMRVIDDVDDEVAQLFSAVPRFTLYGDGTLVYASPNNPLILLQSQLPEDAVLDLLEEIVDEDFLNFRYEQVGDDWREGRPTTYLYAQTLEAANAVRVVALETELGKEHGSEWDEFRSLQKIAALLQGVDPVALGGSEPAPFVPEAVIEFKRLDFEGAFTETRIEGEAIRELAGEPMLGLATFETPISSGERGYLPALPYEDNFPEFDSQ